MSTLVIGAGLSGLAVAWSLAGAGRPVTLVHASAGASEFSAGVYDHELWEEAPDSEPLSSSVAQFLQQLGASLPVGGAWVATAAGVVRPTRGLDDAVLNLERLSGLTIGVVDVARPQWDAESLARSFQASDWARRTRTKFSAASVAFSPKLAQQWGCLSPLDWAQQLEHGQAGALLVKALRDFGPQWAGFLVGPWLALSTQSGRDLAGRLGRPLGETLSIPGCTAGERFASGRALMLKNLGIVSEQGRLSGLKKTAAGWCCEGQFSEESKLPEQHFRHAVLAVGGLVGGGVRFLAGEEKLGGRSFSLSLEAPVHLRLRRREVVVHSGSQGVDLQALGMDALTRVGVSVGAGHRVDAQPGLFAIGDVVADRPRSGLVAIESGLNAAHQILAE